MSPVALSAGQSEALSELREIVRINDGRIRMGAVRDPSDTDDRLAVDIFISCHGETTDRSSVRLQDWEPVTISIPPPFPFTHPDAHLPHRRFAQLPHVVWAHTICLYLAANDWDPAGGMHGFVAQLLTWFEAVARGTIEGPEAPWHAPLTYRRTGEVLAVTADLPRALESSPDGGGGLALAVVKRYGTRYEIGEWHTSLDAAAALANWYARKNDHADEEGLGQLFLAPVAALPRPVGFAYPRRRAELLDAITEHGLSRQEIQRWLDFARQFNRATWRGRGDAPDVLLLGSPAPERYAIRSRVAHLTAWAMNVVAAADAEPDPVYWLTVYDQRPTVTTRRDTTRPARWLAGKRVLVLGCGALGAPSAEFVVRAGAGRIYLVDDGAVRPGVLVRQPYFHDEIGLSKAEVLADRLAKVNMQVSVLPKPGDAIDMINGGAFMPDVDLVIDATANQSVAAALERARRSGRGQHPVLLSMMVGHDCERAVATLALAGSTGAGVDILRRLAITASVDAELYDVLDDFFPDDPRGNVFQPEPGCSDPTYVGSAADLAGFAGQLLNEALGLLTFAEQAGPDAFPQRWASVVRSSTAGAELPTRQRRSWPGDRVQDDAVLQYEIRIDPGALASIRREVRRMAERAGPLVETGGMLLGQIDQASRVVWVTEADGPPPGSLASAEALQLDTEQARGWAQRRRQITRGMVAYIGAWHTHPSHEPSPSGLDDDAMKAMAGDGVPVLLMILGGGPGRLGRWVDSGEPPQIHTQLYFPGPHRQP
ncbi:ThiF family adenylyltransferase [Dactylosporangium sp. CA-139066]|uniref:ThiF family adenylyltransferase n=1 Tax=Dactylosporangium sp. CA-139066 TaxID=3239930 RepID=UPI003D930821